MRTGAGSWPSQSHSPGEFAELLSQAATATSHRGAKTLDSVSPPVPSLAPCSQELCSAPSCRARTPCPAPHTSRTPRPLAAPSRGPAPRCQALLGPSLARPVFSGLQGPCLFAGPRASLGFWLGLGLGRPQGLLRALQPGHGALLGPRL